jgi:hypothetical protein
MFLFLILMSVAFLDGAVGCKNSCGLHVECQCSCKKHELAEYKGQCQKCGHFGDLDRAEVAEGAAQLSEKQLLNNLRRAKKHNS